MKRKLRSSLEEFRFRVGCYALSAVFLSSVASVANGGVTVTVQETTSGVTFTASGSLNLAGLTKDSTNPFSYSPSIVPNTGRISLGADYKGPLMDVGDNYRPNDGETITRPSSFGSGAGTSATFGTGDLFSFIRGNSPTTDPDILKVPDGYVSGTAINATATFDGATITSLGLSPGQYTWSWGSGGNADSITMTVPQPGTNPPTPQVDNSAEKARLSKAIKKLKLKAKVAQRKGQVAKAKKLKAKAKKFTKKLRAL